MGIPPQEKMEKVIDLEEKMKWDVSPLKVKDMRTFLHTPTNMWSTNDGLLHHESVYRSRLYSSPYVAQETNKMKETLIPSFSLEENNEKISLRHASLITSDSGIGSSQFSTHFYDKFSSLGSNQDPGSSDFITSPEHVKSSLYVKDHTANSDLNNIENIPPAVIQGQMSSKVQRANNRGIKYSFDPTAPPFKPRNAEITSRPDNVIVSLGDSRVLSNTNLKAIDVANYVSGIYDRIPKRDVVDDFSMTKVTYNRQVMTSEEPNPLVSALRNSPILAKQPVDENSLVTSHSKPNFNPAPGSPVPVKLHPFSTFESGVKVQSSQLYQTKYADDVPTCGVGESRLVGCRPLAEIDLNVPEIWRGRLETPDFFAKASVSSNVPLQKKIVTFADMVQAGIDAINKQKESSPLIYDVTKSLQYPIHTSISPVIQPSPSVTQSQVINIQRQIGKTPVDEDVEGDSPLHFPSKYRTEPCTTYHTIGMCPYGEQCNFYHDLKEKNDHPNVTKTSRYKTRLCKTWQKAGECPYGVKCDFAHGTDDLILNSSSKPRYKTRMCKVLQQIGRCPYGAQCTFAHKQDELRTDLSLIYKYKTEICNVWAMGLRCSHGSDCHFAHGREELKQESESVF
uniref:HrZF-1 n=1 Tax=Halocynthia roretzi TaxID=7729 RepID=Q9Y1V9_HALRO|nr:HrZF-1 [Halocynthia roretzi]